MKRKLLLFLLSICFFLPDFAATGQYNFIRVDGGSGLSNSHVKSIIQDSYGFIWLGTRNGLNRYDGVSMKLYNCYDETLQHGNQVISALFEDNHRYQRVKITTCNKNKPPKRRFIFVLMQITQSEYR